MQEVGTTGAWSPRSKGCQVSTTVEEAVRVRPRARRFNVRQLRDFSLIPVILLLLVVGFIISPHFLTTDNMLAVLQQSTELSLLVLGEALVLVAGRMDLSLESTIGVAPVLAVW